jgi:hypothetical protein
MKRIALIAATAVVAGFCAFATPTFAAPGDPFGGDDTGCVPADKAGLSCAKIVSSALAKLNASVIKCHIVQAGHAFQAGHSSNGFDNAEENCEEGPSNTSAKAKFDARMEKAALVCPAAVITSANARRDTLLAGQSNPDSLDALNGSFFCDNTSGNTIAEPGGDDAGSIPSSSANFKCSAGLSKGWAKLVVTVYKCHVKAAVSGFKSSLFDEDGCEDGAPPLRSALARYNAQVQKYIDAGICPTCLTDSMSATNAFALGSAAVGDLDTQNAEIFPCP